MKSLDVYEFRNAIQSFVRESELPDEVKRMVLESILNEQAQLTLKTLNKEVAEREDSQDGNAESV